MGFGTPKVDEPPPPANAPTMANRDVASAGSRQRQQARAGFAGTLLTGPGGVLSGANTTRGGSKSLLGD